VPDNPHRLPLNAAPFHYRIRLEPDLDRSVFDGYESIDIEVLEPTSSLVLNSIEIEVSEATVDQNGQRVVAEVSYDEEKQRITLVLPDNLDTGPATLNLAFTGILNDRLHGFYRSTYTDVDGNTQTIATTQFEAPNARRAFPCWDEPEYKATFGITLVVPEDLLAISNSREISRNPVGNGKVEVTFSDTMKMSTYLVAFVVGPFEPTEAADIDGVPMRIIAPRGKTHLTDYASECGAFCLRYLRDYYRIPYPGDKIDMVAIPDFAFGAMENLGCVTFRESLLLVDPDEATQAELVRILDVIAHELAHMWFGDLVTMKWWDGIWLNEAFATFMEMKATDAYKPEWKRWLSFAAVERPWAFGVDSLASTRPVEFEVGSPEEADEMFDALTYGKGSSVLRMIEQYLSEETFRRGVGNYLRRHAYGNTVTADLWEGLDEASGVDVGDIMDTWILQSGFPRIEVETGQGALFVRQRRFLSIPDETDTTLWKVPIQIRGESDGRPFKIKQLLDEPSATIPIDGPIDWMFANAGGHGFYRTAYDESSSKALLAHLDDLDDLERYCLIDDAWAFVEAGDVSSASFLELAGAYRDETEQAVWQAVLGGLGAVRHHLVTDEDLGTFCSFVTDLLSPIMTRLGWETGPDEDDLTRRLRGQIIGALGRLADDQETISRSRLVAEAWLERQSGLDPDVAQASLFTMAAHGDITDYNRLFSRYSNAETPQTQLKSLQALTLFDRNRAVDQTLHNVLDGSIRTQDAAWVVARLFSGRKAGAYAWRRTREQWDRLIAQMPPMTVRRFVEGLPALSHPDVAQDVRSFFAETSLPVAAKALRQNLERLSVNTSLRQRETESLAQYLTEIS